MSTDPFDIRKRGWRNYSEWLAWSNRRANDSNDSPDYWLEDFGSDDYSEESMP